MTIEDCRLLIKDAIIDGRIDIPVYEVGSGEEALDFYSILQSFQHF